MILYNFQVCSKFHNTRTKALYYSICKKIQDRGQHFFLISEYDQKDEIPVLKLSDKDDYNSAIDKTLNCFKYHFTNNQSNFDFFFYGDDDTFINFKNLNKLVSKLSKTELAVYGNIQRMYRYKTFQDDIHITGGPGILMNRRTFKVISEAIIKYNIRDAHFSDVSLALNILKYNNKHREKINLVNIIGFFQDHHWDYEAKPIQEHQYQDVMTYHLRSWLKDKKTYDEVFEIYNKLSIYDE